MLKEHKGDILFIASVNDVTEDVARDMFIANVEKGEPDGTYWYDGAPWVNYNALKNEWSKLTTEEKENEAAAYLE